jgi:hypothetical protein
VRVSVRYGPVRFYGAGALALWVVGRLLRGVTLTVAAAATHPRTTATICSAAVTVWAVAAHPAAVAVTAAAALVVCEMWSLAAPGSFHRRVTLRGLAAARSVFVYRRRWQQAMRAAELVVDDPHVPPAWRVPRLSRVRCTPTHDLVRVRGLLGQTVDAWERAGPVLASAFGARDVWIVRGDDRRLTVELERARRGRAWARP